MQTLRQALSAFQRKEADSFLLSAAARVESDYKGALAAISSSGRTVYGFNTYPGHLAKVGVSPYPEEFSHLLLRSHTIGGPPHFDDDTCRAITLAKAYSVSAGGQLISPTTYARILHCLADPQFLPQIPMHASYSSGDVIPAAHWASALIAHPPSFADSIQPGETMALLNGAFIHVGALLGTIPSLEAVWLGYLETLRHSLPLCSNSAEFLLLPHAPERALVADCATYIRQGFETLSSVASEEVQPAVSVRATAQALDGANWAIEKLLQELDYWLAKPSNNPLFFPESEHIAASGSFVAPSLSLASNTVSDAMLMLNWLTVQRVSHMIDRTINRQASAKLALEFIQAPKLLQALLEKQRREHASKVFVSGSATSHEIEDFWTHGVELTHQLRRALDTTGEMISIEWAVMDALNVIRNSSSPVTDTMLSERIAERRDLSKTTHGWPRAPAALFALRS